MPYSTNDDLLKEMSFADLAKLAGDPAGIVIDVIRTDHARSNADAIINAYLFGRYQVPLPLPTDPIINKISNDMTLAILYDYAYQLTNMPYTIVVMRANAIKLLKEIQLGYVSLLTAEHTVNAPPAIISNKTPEDRLFDEDKLSTFLE